MEAVHFSEISELFYRHFVATEHVIIIIIIIIIIHSKQSTGFITKHSYAIEV